MRRTRCARRLPCLLRATGLIAVSGKCCTAEGERCAGPLGTVSRWPQAASDGNRCRDGYERRAGLPASRWSGCEEGVVPSVRRQRTSVGARLLTSGKSAGRDERDSLFKAERERDRLCPSSLRPRLLASAAPSLHQRSGIASVPASKRFLRPRDSFDGSFPPIPARSRPSGLR